MIISISWWPTQETNGKHKQANALSDHISHKTRGWGGGMKRCVFWRKLSKLLNPYCRLLEYKQDMNFCTSTQTDK